MKKFFTLLLLICCACSFAFSTVFALDSTQSSEETPGATEIFYGQKISVEDRVLEYKDQTETVAGVVVSPSGACYKGNFTVNEFGTWKVIYTAYFIGAAGDTVEQTETMEYFCQRRGTDLFTYNDRVNISYGDYKYGTAAAQHSGVMFTVQSGAEITFNISLDPNTFEAPVSGIGPNHSFLPVEEFRKIAPLIDFIVEPNKQFEKDFTGLTIRIADSADSDNYIEIVCADGESYGDNTMTYVRAGFDGLNAGWDPNPVNPRYITTDTGTGVQHSFQAYPADSPSRNMRLYFDYETKCMYGNRWNFSDETSTLFINDFTNDTLYQFNPWEGFTSDEVTVSLYPTDFVKEEGKILIKSIAGYDFSQSEVLEDTEKPLIEIDYNGQKPASLPDAVIGKPYTVFSATVTDNYDKDLTVSKTVLYKDQVNNVEIDVGITDGAFTPTREGTYVIRYTARDRMGNEATEEVEVHAVSGVTPIAVTLPQTVGTVTIYRQAELFSEDEIGVSGGTGTPKITRTVVDPKGKPVEVVNNKFIPELLGKYIITYVATDYVGNTDFAVYTLNVVGGADEYVVTKEVSFPPILINGFSYDFPLPTVIDTSNASLGTLPVEIRADGKTVEDKYTVDTKNSTVTLEYVVILNGETAVIDRAKIPVIQDPAEFSEKQQAFFYDAASIFTKTLENTSILFESESNGEILFANKLDAENFSLRMSFREVNFSEIYLVLTDAVNGKSVTFTLNVKDGKISSVSYPGGGWNFSAPVALDSDITVSLDGKAGLFSAGGEGNVRQTFDDGTTYGGFENGVYLKVGIRGVTAKSRFGVVNLNNQSFGTWGSNRVAPAIIAVDELVYNDEQEFGAVFVFPGLENFKAYDVFGEISRMWVEIQKPKGDTTTDETFLIDQYGTYTVTYYAEDTAGNISEYPLYIYVRDYVAPTLEISDLKGSRYSIGDVIEVPKYTVQDNLGSFCVDVILILPDNTMRLLTHDENGEIVYYLNNASIYPSSFRVDESSFRTEMQGEYTLRYVAYDDAFNTTTVELKFNVE